MPFTCDPVVAIEDDVELTEAESSVVGRCGIPFAVGTKAGVKRGLSGKPATVARVGTDVDKVGDAVFEGVTTGIEAEMGLTSVGDDNFGCVVDEASRAAAAAASAFAFLLNDAPEAGVDAVEGFETPPAPTTEPFFVFAPPPPTLPFAASLLPLASRVDSFDPFAFECEDPVAREEEGVPLTVMLVGIATHFVLSAVQHHGSV